MGNEEKFKWVGENGEYKVKCYHMDDDEFRCKLYPQSWIDYTRY